MDERLSKTTKLPIEVTLSKLNERFEAKGHADQVRKLMETEEFKTFFSEKLLKPLKEMVEPARSFLDETFVKDCCDSEFLKDYCYNNLMVNLYYEAIGAYLDHEVNIEEEIRDMIDMELLKAHVIELYNELSNKVVSLLLAKHIESRMRAYGLMDEDDEEETENPVS